jgi:hypothetical protein
MSGGRWSDSEGRMTMQTFLANFVSRRRLTELLVVFVMVAAALVVPANKAAAQPVVLDRHVPFDFAATNPCTGEPFTGSGFFHLKITLTVAPNFHLSVEENFESAQGTTASGVRYVVPLQLATHTIIDSDVAPVTATQEVMEQFIRQGEDGTFVMGDDFFLRFKFHLTVNANGDVTASFSDFTITCK